MTKFHKYLCVVASTLLIGCASGDAELKDSVIVNSRPNGAMIQVDNVRVGRAPIRIVLERTQNHEITVSASGQATRKVIVRPALKNNDYGYADTITVELTPAEGPVPAEDIKEFDELKSVAMLPFGANPASYGTLESDLADAKLVDQKLIAIAAAARKAVENAEATLAKAIEDAKTKPAEGESTTAVDLNKTEDSLRAALNSAIAAEEKIRISQKAVDERIALLEEMKKKREAMPAQSSKEPEPKPAPDQAVAQKPTVAVNDAQAESRARTYAIYTARKGLLEREVRIGEITREQYHVQLTQLDKELRNL